ncbi:hypothetical protein FDO65_14395 [Nakamurella flava]|uniref:Transcription factor zinc-finger domain-containing protein n=1 Tax=Nakamurella flava TaxID=2576308 RepID=A0A4U6QFB3_9ACTN|nr:zf-TFIIB domain-containing protein [Nakamurella flava]TKV58706.1 hypothetical protein FDO65_14395 [Nakamurella flava]
MTMICPKCHDVMRQYERNGVTVDQCQECRGIFLDRGELEYLVAAEARFAAGGPPAAPAPHPAPAAPSPMPAPASSSPLAGLLPGSGGAAPGGKNDLLRDGAQLLKTAAREYAKHSGKSGKKKGKKSFVEGLFG